MKTRNSMVLVVLVLAMSEFAGSVHGQEDVLAGPKYHNLRYEEDFSYLGGEPGTFTEDMWDSLKWIRLADDWSLTLGGQARLRYESERNKAFGSVEPSQDSFLLQRYFIHGDLKHSDWLRFFL